MKTRKELEADNHHLREEIEELKRLLKDTKADLDRMESHIDTQRFWSVQDNGSV